jgi:hypothetical protein
MTFAVVVTLGLYGQDGMVLSFAALCLAMTLNGLRRAGQYRYDPATNTVVARE